VTIDDNKMKCSIYLTKKLMIIFYCFRR